MYNEEVYKALRKYIILYSTATGDIKSAISVDFIMKHAHVGKKAALEMHERLKKDRNLRFKRR